MLGSEITVKLAGVYRQLAPATTFLTSFFKALPRNFYNSEKFSFDIVRGKQNIAIPVQSLSDNGRENSYNSYTNKMFTPPIFKEETNLNAIDALKRRAGVDNYADMMNTAEFANDALIAVSDLDAKIRRSVELQAAQVFQYGKIDLKDKNGQSIYVEDFIPKTTHFVTAPFAWDNASADPLKDISDLARTIKKDGLMQPNILIFGAAAWREFIKNDDVRSLYDNRNINIGSIIPQSPLGAGGSFQGNVIIDFNNYEIWLYDGDYVDPSDGLVKPYVEDANVIILSRNSQLDATYGLVPSFSGSNTPTSILPSRLSLSTANGMQSGVDLFITTWMTLDQKAITIQVASRPLMIPTAIDTIGCLYTGI